MRSTLPSLFPTVALRLGLTVLFTALVAPSMRAQPSHGASVTQDSLNWPESFPPLARAWNPVHKTVSQQNPPDFSWPAVDGATAYDLVVSRDSAGTDIAHHVEGLPNNFHNFATTFEPATYFWRARYRTDIGVSHWSEPRRFRIDPDAWKFPVPPVDALLQRVPDEHPRVWVTPGKLEPFRARASGPSKAWLTSVLARVRAEMKTAPPSEPVFPFDPKGPRTLEWRAAHLRLRQQGWDGYGGAATRLRRTAFCHLVTGDKEIGRNAVDQMLNMTTWDPYGATGYATHDQVHRAIAWYSAAAYDWCHGIMTPTERQQVLEMIRTRTQIMVDRMQANRPLNEAPYDSHAWTAFGYVGAISIATMHDLPDATGWFKQTIPAYINTLAPWGGEDGGWAQGPNYWQYSQRSNRELTDVLRSATGFSLYDKAFFHNNAYYPVYAFPHGSPRSHFGDGNGYQPAKHSQDHLRALANVYQDPVLQWAANALGDAKIDQHIDYLGGNLRDYFAFDETLASHPPPPEMPRSRWYRDIDWVTMHSDLTDPERVSLYFKSSPYGSHNHSHADQNSFVLNAYGEALAIDAGYYDSYATPHDKTFTRQTLAHNAITLDGGFGQPIFDITAKGDITGFVNTARVDAATGDATGAYKGALARAIRHIIYLRPATFVIIDDLEAASGKKSKFEWWLHALEHLAIDDDQAGATIIQGKAALRVSFVYPENLTASKRTEFIGPPNAYDAGKLPVHVPPVPLALGDTGTASQIHAWFSTPETRATKIVAVLQATRAGVQSANFTARQNGDALELSFASGETVVVRLADDGEIASGDLAFRGAAAAIVGETTLLVRGDRLQRANKTLLEASVPVTAAIDADVAAFSATDDGTLTLGWQNVSDLRDHRGRPLAADLWSAGSGSVQVKAEPGPLTVRAVSTKSAR